MADWMELGRGVVHPWHLDHFGHMNVRHYAPFFDDASYQIWTKMGFPYSRMIETFGVHCVAASVTTTFVRELKAGDLIVIDGAATHLGSRSATFRLRMCHADTGALHATYDMVEVVFDPKTRRSAPMPDALRRVIETHLVTEDDL